MIDFSRFNIFRFWQKWWQRLWRRIPLYSFKLYMIEPDPSGECSNDGVVEVRRGSTTRPISIEQIYNELLSLDEREYNDEGLINALWQSRLELERAYVDGADVAHIFLSGELVADEPCADSRITAQLKRPARQVLSGAGTVRSTEVQINGRPLEDVLSG